MAFVWLAARGTSPAAAQEPAPAEVRAKVLAESRTAFVHVDFHLRLPADVRDLVPGGAGEVMGAVLLTRQQEMLARDRKALEMMGVILAGREVLVPDHGVDPQYVDRIEVVDAAGKRTPARRKAILVETPAVVLEPVDPGQSWAAPTYQDATIDESNSLVVVAPDRDDLEWRLAVTPVRPVIVWNAEKSAPQWPVGASVGAPGTELLLGGSTRPGAARLVFSSDGKLLGAAFTSHISPPPAAPAWRANQLAKGERLAIADWEKRLQHLRDMYQTLVRLVRVEFRRPRSGPPDNTELELAGLALSDRLLLVFQSIGREQAARIDKITVSLDGQTADAGFVGALQDFDGFLIQLEDKAPALGAHADLRPVAAIPPYRPHVTMTVSRRYGANDLRTDYTRVIGQEQGYGNRPVPQLRPTPSLGSLLMTLDGQPVGIFARRRRVLEELDQYDTVSLGALRGQPVTGSQAELFAVADWIGLRKEPARYIDSRVVRRDEKDQERRCWLGVEFARLSRDLAETLGCRQQSRDGQIGLLVNLVYPHSPAAELGIRPGDVLMTIEVADRSRPIELTMQQSFSGNPADFRSMLMRQRQMSGGGDANPWPARNNYLTGLLGAIGTDTPVRVRLWRDGKLQTVTTKVALAPPDQDSATQYRDESLGFTVKELTYEVRTALRLKPADPGVVVSKVESGTPAAQARLRPGEIVQAADGKPLTAPAVLEEIIKSTRAAKREQIRIVVVDRGQSRFADLRVGQ
jgi:hypothetical protein